VSATTGVAGFIFAGDRVDLVLTQQIDGSDDSAPLKTAETVLRNLRVLATDQTVEKTTDENGKTVVTEFRTVTLEVTPKIAEKIAVAQTIGTISLALRSLADNQAELDQAIASGTVKLPAGATKEQEEKLLSQAMNRPQDGATTFVTGGDVSRFERRTMPPPPVTERPATASGPSAAPGFVAAPRGPIVRVTRGKNTSVEQVGSR
jgi:pilus assembly protein CpaB